MISRDGTMFFVRDQNGVPFEEYMTSVVQDGTKTIMTAYIEIKPETRYPVHCEAPPRYDASRVKFLVDNNYLRGHTVSQGKYRRSQVNGLSFSAVELTDNEDDCLLDEEVLSKLGEIEIKLSYGIEGTRQVDEKKFEEKCREREEKEREGSGSAKILESTKKFEIAARTSFKNRKRSNNHHRHRSHSNAGSNHSNYRFGPQPFANNNFNYNRQHQREPYFDQYQNQNNAYNRQNPYHNNQNQNFYPPQLQTFNFQHQMQLPRYNDDRYDRPPMKVINTFQDSRNLPSFHVKFFYRTKASLSLLGIETAEERERMAENANRSSNRLYLGHHEVEDEIKDEKENDGSQAKSKSNGQSVGAVRLGKRKGRISEDGRRIEEEDAREVDAIINVDYDEDDEVYEVRPIRKKPRVFEGSTYETAIDLTGD